MIFYLKNYLQSKSDRFRTSNKYYFSLTEMNKLGMKYHWCPKTTIIKFDPMDFTQKYAHLNPAQLKYNSFAIISIE